MFLSFTLLCYIINELRTWMKGGKDKSIQVKHLHLIRCEPVSPSQDCVLVLYSTWNRVRGAKSCAWISATVSIVSNVDVMPATFTKCWTNTWVPVYCIWWSRHHALKWSKTFSVAEWKYERIGCGAKTTNGLWMTRILEQSNWWRKKKND